MLDRKLSSWFYPKPTGDPGRDRNTRTLQFACFLFAFAIALVAVLDTIAQERIELPILVLAAVALVAAAAMNRGGMSAWAARIAILAVLLTAVLLVLQARDGFRSHAMLVFPGLLLISVTLLDRAYYVTTAGTVLVAVAALGIAEKHGLTGAIPGVRSPTSYDSVFYVDLTLVVFALIGSRIAGDAQKNVFDLRAGIDQLSAANLELTKIAEALHESEERFRATFYQAAVGIAQTSLDGRWLLVNDRLSEILGYSSSELSGRTFVDITHPGDREDNLKARRQLLAGEISSWSTEKRYIRKDGVTAWARVFVSIVRDHQNQPQYFISVIEDITEKIQAERALRDTEQRLTLAQSAAQLGVWNRNLGTQVVTFSREYARLYGLPPEQSTLTHEEWLRLIHPDDREMLPAQVQETLERTNTFNTEYRVIWPDGSVRWLMGKGTVFLDDSGRPASATGVTMDITERKQAEAALRESEERFRTMADTAPVMIWISGLDKLCTFFNKGWLDFTGCAMEQELGNGWANGVHPDDLDRCFATYSSSFDARSSFRMEYRLRRADGEYCWVLDIGVPLYKGGEFSGYIGSCIDVTEQRLAQDRLRTNERRLINAQRLSQVGSWERTLETDTICWSDEMLRILGLPNDPPVRFLTFLSRVHPEDREKIREADDKVRLSTGPIVLEYRIVRPDGEVRFVRSVVEGIRDDQDTPVRIVGATQDVTDRKRVDDERARLATLVQNEHERLNAIISSIPGAVWETRGSPDNPAKQVKFMSNQVEEMLGYSAEQWMTAPGLWPLIVHSDDRSRFMREAIEIFTSDKGSGSHQYRCLTKDGRTVWLESHASAIREKTGTPIGLRGVTIEITERKETQAALQRAQEELARVTRVISMGELAVSIAHEINQPLAAVVTNGEACLRYITASAPNIEKAKDILMSIISDANRAGEVIRRIRTLFAKASAQKEIFDLNQLIRDTILLLEQYAQSHDVLIRTNLEESLPAVFGDRTQLRQLLLNLVMNGIEATGRHLHGARLVVIMTRSDAHPGIQLEVSDSGIGIPPGDRERIFHAFFTTKEGGLGMGLSISRTIVESHGGRILVEPNQPHGTRFLVLLPNERMT